MDQTGENILFVLDVSRSMLARDVKPSRLARARLELTDLIDTLQQDYGIDPARLFEQAKIDPSEFERPGARVPLSKMTRLWDMAVFITGDQQFGLKAGIRARPSGAHALGHAWLASSTLRDALERYCRYAHVVSTAITHQDTGPDGVVDSKRSRPSA